MFSYVSTAYAYLHVPFLLEKPYAPPADPHKIIKSVELLHEDEIEKMKDEILGNLPNSYSFTKALAESLVCEAIEKQNLPGLIIRPSIVIPTLLEPVTGWTDNLNGPAGLLIGKKKIFQSMHEEFFVNASYSIEGAGKGAIRTIYCSPKSYADFLPVDVAVNGFITSTWHYLTYPE